MRHQRPELGGKGEPLQVFEVVPIRQVLRLSTASASNGSARPLLLLLGLRQVVDPIYEQEHITARLPNTQM